MNGRFFMSKIIFNEHQRRQLETNPNVTSVSDRAIQYTAEFKIRRLRKINQEKDQLRSLVKLNLI